MPFAPNPSGQSQFEIGAGYPAFTEPGPVSSRVTRTYSLPEKK